MRFIIIILDLGEGSGILPLAELHDFSYSDSRLRDVIFDNLRNTDFIGITVSVKT